MESYFVALTPNERVKKEITKAKLEIFERFGVQKFLLDKPHCTLYVSVAKDLKEVEKRLKEIALNQKIIKVNIVEGWKEFKEDKLAGGGTSLALKFTEESNRNILALQKRIINALNKLREGKVNPRYRNLQLPKTFEESVGKYGYPFASSRDVEDILIPHIGFCCFADYENVREFKESYNFKKFAGHTAFPKLSLYKLYPDDKSELIRHFSLQ